MGRAWLAKKCQHRVDDGGGDGREEEGSAPSPAQEWRVQKSLAASSGPAGTCVFRILFQFQLGYPIDTYVSEEQQHQKQRQPIENSKSSSGLKVHGVALQNVPHDAPNDRLTGH